MAAIFRLYPDPDRAGGPDFAGLISQMQVTHFPRPGAPAQLRAVAANRGFLAEGGFLPGTLLETPRGWCAVESLAAGISVQTFDGGLRPIRALRVLGGRRERCAAHIVEVPGGALNTCSAFEIPAEQRLLLEIPAAENRVGSPFVAVPAGALVGWQGITSRRDVHWCPTISLHFDEEEIVWANTGALVVCPATGGAATASYFPRCGFDATRELLGLAPMRRPVPATECLRA